MITRPSSTADHWLTFEPSGPNGWRGRVTGCHCGFKSDQEEDNGYGDSVVDHLIDVGIEYAARVADRAGHAWPGSGATASFEIAEELRGPARHLA